MIQRFALAAALLTLSILPAAAQAPPASTPARVGGTIDKLDGRVLTVNGTNGQKESVTLTPEAKVFGVEKRKITDIKTGDFVASGGVKGTDGKIHAVDVRIFPEELRGVAEGQRAWDVKPDGVMTNATVGTVSQAGGGQVVKVTYKGGESEYSVGPDVPILAYVAADMSLLKSGAAVLIIAQKKADGSLTTGRVTVEKDGVKPPM